MTCDIFQFRGYLPTSRANDEHRFSSLSGYHTDRCYEIRIIRNNGSYIEHFFPGVIQQMCCKIYVRTFLFHRVNFCNYCISNRFGHIMSFFLSFISTRITTYRQCL